MFFMCVYFLYNLTEPNQQKDCVLTQTTAKLSENGIWKPVKLLEKNQVTKNPYPTKNIWIMIILTRNLTVQSS